MRILTDSAQETIEAGEHFGRCLRGGEIIGLYGELGSGKTHFIKGVAKGAGVDKSDYVNSPTFVIVNEYNGRLDIYHVDAYRLENLREFEMLGLDDMCYPGSVVLIEWADRVEKALDGIDLIRIELRHMGTNTRELVIGSCPKYLADCI